MCIPASRSEPCFLEALDSALAQEPPAFEVIVTDDSGGALEPTVIARLDPRIRYERNPERLGLPGNHCRALDLVTGDVVAFLHDDDVWRPGYLAAAIDALQEDERIGLVLTSMEDVDEDGSRRDLRPSLMEAGVVRDPLSVFLRPDFVALIPSASVFRTSALAANPRPWPDVPAGDLTMYIDIVLDGWLVRHVPQPLVRYRVHTGQSSRDSIGVLGSLIQVLGRYRFEDVAHERLRRRRVAYALSARAAANLRAGDRVAARADVGAGWRGPERVRPAWALVVWTLSFLPPLVFRAVDRWAHRAHARLGRPHRAQPARASTAAE